MIDVKDIMVGDLLQNTNGNVGKVIGIEVYDRDDDEYDIVMRYSDNSTCYSNPKLLQLIQLTPAILEKNGWFFRTGFWTKKGPVRLSWKEDGTLIVGYFQFPCAVEFVHTLQNILRILGLEDIVL